MSNRLVQGLALVLLMLAMLTGCGGDETDSTSEELAVHEADLGSRVYQRHCAGCHGETGEGSTACLTLVNPHIDDQSDARLYAFISTGTGGTMPAFGDLLSQEEIVAVISHLRALQNPIGDTDGD